MDVIAYLRVSTDEQGRSGLGLEAQRGAIAEAAEIRGWRVVDWVQDEASGKSLNRPGIQLALSRLENGGPSVLVAAKLDRLARSALDFLGLVERAERNGWALIMLQPNVDMTDPMGRFTAGILAQVAQLERDLIAKRTSEALQAKKKQGARLGRPIELSEEVRQLIVDLRSGGLTLREIADRLSADQVPTAHHGARWYASTVSGVLRSVELDAEVGAGN